MIRSISLKRPFVADNPPRISRLVIPYMVAYGAGVLEAIDGAVIQPLVLTVPPTPSSKAGVDIICTTHLPMSANRSIIHC